MEDPIDKALERAGMAAYLAYADSSNPDMMYLTEFQVNDPLVYLKKRGEGGILIVPQMEYDRALQESRCEVINRGDAGFFDDLEKHKDGLSAMASMVSRLVGDGILLSPDVPVSFSKKIETFCRTAVDEGTVSGMRSVKTLAQADNIRNVQKTTEEAMDLAISLIRGADCRDGELYLRGEPLTSDYIRNEMHCFFLRRGLAASDTIVSCGKETAIPHCIGSGVILENEPVVIDVFPCDSKSGYYSDMTRTVVRGEPDPEIEAMYSCVRDAKIHAKGMIAEGRTGKEIHEYVVNFFDENGYTSGKEGFIHILGHGVGLAVHEGPSLSPSGGKLVEGNIVTVEPGLYYKKIGGVRLEDIGMVTKTGFDCFTDYPEDIRI
ncbi:M24 family metallopeptidase [Methanolacinia petrolearia]|uniref:M24 family metallopeptidase n=1 Tax=Methanolacinia petrolearia TaxID=54120 RepID=UPI003BA9E432